MCSIRCFQRAVHYRPDYFLAFSIQTILFCAHTCVAILEQEMKDSSKKVTEKVAPRCRKTKLTLALAIIWCIIGFALLSRQAHGKHSVINRHWSCRHVESKRVYAMDVPFIGQLFSTITVAVVWYFITLAHVLQYLRSCIT